VQLTTYKASVPAAIAIGAIQSVLIAWCWAYIAMYSPIPRFLVDLGLAGTSWRAALWLIDMLINIALTLPAAFLLTRLRPRNLPLYVVAAVLPMFIWQSRLVFFGEIDPRVSLTAFVPGWAMELLVLPLAIALLVVLRRSRGPTTH
jgi:hypothetical protein